MTLMSMYDLENEIEKVSKEALEKLTRHKYKVKEPRIKYTLPSYLKTSGKDTPSISGVRIRAIDSDFESSFDPPDRPLGFQSYYHIDLILKVERVDKDPVFIEVDIKADIEKFL